ncbi:SGNH/GDSL hydrolase family protein [Bacillus sp. 31A1R]|uniref:SGNH/GDSL hydrolase family protein n=1 Tax=Robertmurraya mangrovi TaxID=3098077 RepID=A0ABU5IZ50_9BACI|nr:SGNH/GDSL hydrolase family protein [Bacillus sp. 31A1R]MDZ5472440.1 SGNH/GDSL hydrolase family protein [Bacillus sp. 31A1R]
MKNKKVWITSSGVILVCALLSLFLLDFSQLNRERVSGASFVNGNQDTPSVVTTVEEEELQESSNIDAKPVAEIVKEKVREVIEGTFAFFSNGKKIVAIGDSLTQGVGDETDSGGYVGILNHTFEDNNLDISIQNFGKRGNRTDQLLKRLETEEVASAVKDADIMLITIGANDIMKVIRSNYTNLKIEPFQEEKKKYVVRLTAIFNKINELNPDIQVYLIGFYNPFERYFGDIEQLDMILNDWNEAGELVTEEYENINYIPTKDLFSHSSINLLADDNFHPNTIGYKLMAQRVLEYLNKYEETELPIEVTKIEGEVNGSTD